uniref:Uncharacterized protein n=1 Tax=Oryzias melastigma TaxID=30732 RepID=A0A3B3DRH2_ORYME
NPKMDSENVKRPICSFSNGPSTISLFYGAYFRETPYRCRTECGLPISIVHCSSELLSSNDPPASASMTLGLQAHATTPGGTLYHKSAL